MLAKPFAVAYHDDARCGFGRFLTNLRRWPVRMRGFVTPARLALAAGLALAALQPPAAATLPNDPLLRIVHRMNRYFHGHEVDGVTLDSRYAINPTEVVRLSVVSQLLGYAELYKAVPSQTFRQDIVERADYLAARFDEVSSRTAFDGMLAYSFLEAYDATRDPSYLDKGRVLVEQLEGLSGDQIILNGGLMAAMAFAKYHRLTGDDAAAQRARDVVGTLPAYQHQDGGFPHWCSCSKDVHYTDWMSMELILIQRMLDDPAIEPILEGTQAFMEGRVDASGNTRNQEPCPDYPGCTTYYYSIATGCSIDYDTRAFTNELGYSALLFDHFHSPKYFTVMRFLRSLENRGTFADKWDFWPPPDDPYYPWTVSDTSVVNMSVIFWSLSSIVSARRAAGASAEYALLADGEDEADGSDGTLLATRSRGLEPSPLAGARTVPDGLRLAPEDGAAAPARRWTAVDSLLIAGADPSITCDATSRSVGTPARDEPGTLTTPPRTILAAGGLKRSEPAARLQLWTISPDPGRGGCDVQFTLPASTDAALDVYDVDGRRVRELLSGRLGPGRHAVHWDERDAAGVESPSGLYFLRLQVGPEARSTKAFVIR